jgi:hypothetical protein
LEIVLVSSDRDEGSFGEYFKKMPGLAMIPAFTGSKQNARKDNMDNAFKVEVRF